MVYRTGKLVEAAMLRALGATFEGVEVGPGGKAVLLDVSGISKERLQDAAATLSEQMDRVADPGDVRDLLMRLDNTVLPMMFEAFYRMRDEVKRSR